MTELNSYQVKELNPAELLKVDGGLLLINTKLLDSLLEAGKRMHESYTAIKSGLIDGWNECSCQS